MSVSNIKSRWVSGNLSFQKDVAAAQIHFGVDDTGLDVKFFGATASAYLLWDESADQLTTGGVGYIGGRTDANGIGIAAGIKADTGDPGTTGAVTGSLVYNVNDAELLVYTGSAWIGAALT
jgi:hypothetical protein